MKLFRAYVPSNTPLAIVLTLILGILSVESSRADEFDAFMNNESQADKSEEGKPFIRGEAVVANEEFLSAPSKEKQARVKGDNRKGKKLSERKEPTDTVKPADAPTESRARDAEFSTNNKAQQRYIPLPEEDPVVIDQGVPYYFE